MFVVDSLKNYRQAVLKILSRDKRNAVNNFQSLGAVKGSIVRKSWQASDMKFMNLIDVFTH